MNKSKASTVVLIILSFLTFGLSPTEAQNRKPAVGDWTLLETTQPGQDLEVKLKSGDTIRGAFNGLSATMLIVSKGGSLVETDRNRISKVYQVGGTNVKKSTLIGLGIGAAAGAIIGGVAVAADSVDAPDDDKGLVVLTFAAAGAIIGTAAGVFTGLSRKKKVLVYESR